MLPAASQSFRSTTEINKKVEKYSVLLWVNSIVLNMCRYSLKFCQLGRNSNDSFIEVKIPAQQSSSTTNRLISHRSENL